MKQVVLRAMYFMLGGMVCMVLLTEQFNTRLAGIVSVIPPLVGGAVWQGCQVGQRFPKVNCERLGRDAMLDLQKELGR